MDSFDIIRSPRNAKLKVASAVGQGRDRTRFLIEGVRVLGEALALNLKFDWVLFDAERRDERLLGLLSMAQGKGVACVPCDSRLLKEIGDLDSPSGVLAVASRPSCNLEEVLEGANLVVVAAGIQDPGNLGAIVRVSAGLGADAVITFAGGASLFHPRAIRSASCSTFRIPVVDKVRAEDFFVVAAAKGFSCWATALSGEDFCDSRLETPTALLLGAEGHGLEKDFLTKCDKVLAIPLSRNVESLNVASAAAVFIYNLKKKLT